ncbi:MAG: 16S rRNA (cytosine(1402)-N(4))-methyltransferase RsmH [Saprospiraceae bacterium]|nr:16S rRNA (cytosine(1402)-N(4))-methyltransferase RsmH [Saprospiraceae bacterium]
MGEQEYHVPVLLDESIRALNIIENGIYIDATLGGGGHCQHILDTLGPNGRVLAFDQDEAAGNNVPEDDRLTFIPHNFRHIERFTRFYGVSGVDGILADLGVSSHQFDVPERGFSYRFPEMTLDMRMDTRTGKTAADLLNQLEPGPLQQLLGEYGEVRNARTVAAAIVQFRRQRPFKLVGDLLEVLHPLIRGERHRYLAQVFQALRIAVNEEMTALEEMLEGALNILNPGGMLVILTYHSLEDRLVKRFMRSGKISGEPEKDFYGNMHRPFEVLTKNPVLPGMEEQERNSRAHSAKMRVARKKEQE